MAQIRTYLGGNGNSEATLREFQLGGDDMKCDEKHSSRAPHLGKRNSDVRREIGVTSKKKTKAALKKLVRPHWDIPDELLDEIASLRNFRISHVIRAAKSHSMRYPREKFDCRTMADQFRDSARHSRDLILAGEYALNVYVAGGILEYNLVADELEKMA
jgi:hypothetical protein